ncbi:MAG: hypothetical protein JWN00_5498, partial [Actinomycetia bacterium]|nr:hypothetical protein [Actinomycetes bacterium]
TASIIRRGSLMCRSVRGTGAPKPGEPEDPPPPRGGAAGPVCTAQNGPVSYHREPAFPVPLGKPIPALHHMPGDREQHRQRQQHQQHQNRNGDHRIGLAGKLTHHGDQGDQRRIERDRRPDEHRQMTPGPQRDPSPEPAPRSLLVDQPRLTSPPAQPPAKYTRPPANKPGNPPNAVPGRTRPFAGFKAARRHRAFLRPHPGSCSRRDAQHLPPRSELCHLMPPGLDGKLMANS